MGREARSQLGSGPQGPKSIDALFAEISAARLAYEDAATPLERLERRAPLASLRAEVAGHPRTGLAGLTDAEIQRRPERLTRELDVILDTRLSPAISAGASDIEGTRPPARR